MNGDLPGTPRRHLRVRHTTRYAYDRPVRRSTHRLHLRPVDDFRQRVLDYRLQITTAGPVDVIDYEDVFGNRAERFELTTPYTELTVTATSTVELTDFDPFA